MNSPDHTMFRELLDQEIDGSLTAGERSALDVHLAGCAECRAERESLQALYGVLQRSRLEVRPGFRDQVMEALPAAGWESRHPRTWTFPVAALVALLGAGVGLLGAGSSRLGSAYGVMTALSGMVRAALVAGVGFTTASWRWCSLFVEQQLASPVSVAMFCLFVVCLNLVLFSLIRRRRTARAMAMAGDGINAATLAKLRGPR
jgi:hypothetical protein